MSRRTVQHITLMVNMRLPPGAKVPDAIAFVKDALAQERKLTSPGLPMASLAVEEIVVRLAHRETKYL